MHELSLAQSIFEIVEHHVPDHHPGTMMTVRMKVGELSGVVTESLEFCFEAITEGTRLQGARLDIEHIPLKAECRSCATLFHVEQNNFRCPSCSSTDLSIVAGRELQVTEIEMNDGVESS